MLPLVSAIAHLQLSIEVQSEPIRGSLLGHVGEQPRAFTGWVELANAIEAARCGSTNGAAAEPGAWTSSEGAHGGIFEGAQGAVSAGAHGDAYEGAKRTISDGAQGGLSKGANGAISESTDGA